MIRASRRAVVAAALAAPVAARAVGVKLAPKGDAVLLHDAQLAAGRRFAEAGRAAGAKVLAVEGDRIRFARDVFAANPAYVQGVTRQADAVLIEDVGREFGYRREALCVASATLEWRLVPRI
ncbi:MAG TPA: hypothetical protein VF418_04395 [Sphingomonadaceae bacterium]